MKQLANTKTNKSIIFPYVLWMSLYYVFHLIHNTLTIKLELIHYLVLMLMMFHYIYLVFAKKNGFDKNLIFLFILIPLYMIVSSGFDTVFVILAFIILKYYSLNRVVISSIVVLLLVFFLYIVLYLSGYIVDVVFYKHGNIVHKLGFTNANLGASLMFQMILMVSIYYNDVKNEIQQILLFIISVLLSYTISYLTGNRTFFYALFIYFILLIITKSQHVAFKKILMVSPIFFFLLTCYLPRINEIVYIDDILSGRVYILSLYFAEFDLKTILMGRKLIENMPFDNAYFMLLFNGGITSMIFFLTTYIKGIYNSSSKYLNTYMPFIFIILCTGFSESTFSGLNTTSVVFFRILYEPTRNKFYHQRVLNCFNAVQHRVCT